jgi:hypothetical protein
MSVTIPWFQPSRSAVEQMFSVDHDVCKWYYEPFPDQLYTCHFRSKLGKGETGKTKERKKWN